MVTIILTIHILISIAIVGLVLMQRSEGGGLGIGDGNNFMSLPPIVICTLSKGVSISNPSVDTDAFLTL